MGKKAKWAKRQNGASHKIKKWQNENTLILRSFDIWGHFVFFMLICFPSSAPRAWGIFHLVLNISSTFFPVLRVSRAVQIFILEFSKDGPADLWDNFTDGGSANQPVILKGGVGLSRSQRVSALLPVLIQHLRAS